jgi:hypothetical protein
MSKDALLADSRAEREDGKAAKKQQATMIG